MRVFWCKVIFLLCSAVLGLTPAIAHADPIRVTSGVVTVRFSDLAGASLTGDGLSVNGDGLSSAAGPVQVGSLRSEERRVGKECRSRWSPYH